MLIGEKKIERPFRWGIVGGGKTSQVGYKHRLGAMRDNTSFVLTAAAFDIDFERGREFGKNLCMDETRLYPDYQTMFAEEAKRPDGIEAVDIATPNFLHYEACKAALEAGLHVICEKPLFFEVEQGLEIQKLAEEKGKIVCVDYGFSGFDLLSQMRHMILNGAIGEVTMVDLRYAHGFGCDPTGDTQAEGQMWRVNPAKVGRSFVLGDLSTHTFYMSEMICPQLKLKQVLCDRQSFIKTRAPLEDNAYVLMRFLRQRRRHEQPAHPHRGHQGVPGVERHAPRRAALRGPGPAGPDSDPRHGLPLRRRAGVRASGRPALHRTH